MVSLQPIQIGSVQVSFNADAPKTSPLVLERTNSKQALDIDQQFVTIVQNFESESESFFVTFKHVSK